MLRIQAAYRLLVQRSTWVAILSSASLLGLDLGVWAGARADHPRRPRLMQSPGGMFVSTIHNKALLMAAGSNSRIKGHYFGFIQLSVAVDRLHCPR
jgi:hypothetical protein